MFLLVCELTLDKVLHELEQPALLGFVNSCRFPDGVEKFFKIVLNFLGVFQP